MAIDGVAPRAKMNQQRSRRFKSAQEAQEKEEEEARLREEWLRLGKRAPAQKGMTFDSNTITPGTVFMDRLAEWLRVFIHSKLSTDNGWKGVKVLLPPLLHTFCQAHARHLRARFRTKSTLTAIGHCDCFACRSFSRTALSRVRENTKL